MKKSHPEPLADFDFLGRRLGGANPCLLIAEIGLNHNGDLELAKALIRIAAESGWDAVKLQKRDVANLAVGQVLNAEDPRFPAFGSTYRRIREHLEFDRAQFKELMAAAKRCGIPLFCTPFDIPSLEFLEALGMTAYKLASHSVTNLPLLERTARTGKPVILSTGMCTVDELDRAVAALRPGGPLALLHCVSSYPTPLDQVNLRVMDAHRRRYGVPVGYSGHEVGFLATLAAVARGACAVERHITLNREMAGFDHKLSLDPGQILDLARQVRALESALGDGVKRLLNVEKVTRDKYHVSWVSAKRIPAGRAVTAADLTLKNPGTGIPAHRKGEILGKRARVPIPADVLIEAAMFQVP